MFIILLLIAAFLGSALAYPLWLFATKFQTAFSATVSFLLAALFIFLIVRQIKKHGIKSAIRFTLKFFIVTTGLFISIRFVLTGQRIAALITLIISTAVFIFISKKLRPKISELAAEN